MTNRLCIHLHEITRSAKETTLISETTVSCDEDAMCGNSCPQNCPYFVDKLDQMKPKSVVIPVVAQIEDQGNSLVVTKASTKGWKVSITRHGKTEVHSAPEIKDLVSIIHSFSKELVLQ